MEQLLIKPYEISIWKDELVSGANPYYKEILIARIGSNYTSSPNECFDISFKRNINGETKLNFSIAHQYYDEEIGEKVINPFIPFLVNERKVKLKYDGEWFDFIIKNVEENSDEGIFTYECNELFVNELSKGGYNVSLSTDLANNQGTITELAEQVLEPTDWVVDKTNSDIIRGYIQEPLYKGVILENANLPSIIYASPKDGTGAPEPLQYGETIYFFYSEIANKKTENVQIMRESDHANGKWEFDDNNVASGPNYRIVGNVSYANTTPARPLILDSATYGVNLEFQGYRINYAPISKWDPLTEKYIELYKDNHGKEIYHYTDYEYMTSDILTNYVTNGHEFQLLTEGDIQGWDATTPHTGSDEKHFVKLNSYPKLNLNTPITLSEAESTRNYLYVHFNGSRNITNNGIYQNVIFNSGIEDNRSLINNFSKGEKYIFRIKYGITAFEEGRPVPEGTPKLRVIIAGYTVGSDNTRNIDPSRIYFDMGMSSNYDWVTLNNIVTGGVIDRSRKVYKIENEYGYDVYSPTTDKIYVEEVAGTQNYYVWDPSAYNGQALDGNKGNFVLFNSNIDLQYYCCEIECLKSLSNKDLSESDVGIFLYTIDSTPALRYYWIDDIQIFKKRPIDANLSDIMTIGNVPTAESIKTEYYYLHDEDIIDNNAIVTYMGKEAIASDIGCSVSDIQPVYNEECEKISSIEVEKSNYYNIIQSLCEQFKCWAQFHVAHEENGRISLDSNNNPIKKITFHEYVGQDNFSGFKYGINLNSITRTFASEEIVSKLIVANQNSDYVSGGLTIRRAKSNPLGEDYILNFAYYLNQGLIDRSGFYNDLNAFQNQIKPLNEQLEEKNNKYVELTTKMLKIGSEKTVYGEYLKAARLDLAEAKKLIKQITGIDYETYLRTHGSNITLKITPTPDGTETPAKAEINSILNGLVVVDEDGRIIGDGVNTNGIVYYQEDDFSEDSYYSIAINEVPIGYTYPITKEEVQTLQGQELFLGDSNVFTLESGVVTCVLPLSTDGNEALIECLGRIASDQTVINSYSGVADDLTREYNKLRYATEGLFSYNITFNTTNNHTEIAVNDYAEGIEIELYNGGSYVQTFTSSAVVKVFDYNYTATHFKLVNAPTGYGLYLGDTRIEANTLVPLTNNTRKVYILQPIIGSAMAEDKGLKGEIKELEKEKEEIEKAFYKKYSRYIQEGTWSSDTHVDNDLYYLDALHVSNTSALPKVEYSIKVLEISELEGYENYTFNLGDKTTIEDTEFFGWTTADRITPIREEVIVSEITWHLDKPEENEILVQNYKTRFDDLFQRMSAAVQTVEYNNGSYMRAASALDANGLINSDLLVSSLNSVGGSGQLLSLEGKVVIDGNGVTVSDMSNTANMVRLGGKGLMVSEDGGRTWEIALTPQTINTKYLRAGAIDTSKITIIDGDQPSFRWDASGINAFAFDALTQDEYDYSQFVRFDKYGLYGVKGIDGLNTFRPASLSEVEEKASFGLTWHGFFIRNSYTDGYVSISSDDDFKVVRKINGNEVNKIKIGALEKRANGSIRYGISIKNDYDLEVFRTDDDGNATFNNVNIKGSIKAAVFEYEKINAIGGILLVRPSSAIRNIIEVDDNNNIITLELENPSIFNNNDYCRLGANGQTLRLEKVTGTNYIRLYGYDNSVEEYEDIIGTAVVSMANINNNNITDNYGIAINSSNSDNQFPIKAITLFETKGIVSDNELYPAYSYRGILGTLPDMSTQESTKVNSSIYQYMRDTQGIYTDNMYIGDKTQYLAFYTDNNNNKHLKISAKEVVYDVDPDTGTETTWEEHIREEMPKTAKITGENIFKYNSSNQLVPSGKTITLTATVSGVSITGWKYKSGANWITYPNSSTNPTLTVNPTDNVFSDNSVTIKLETNDISTYDLFTITKLKDGADGTFTYSAVLSNEEQMLPANKEGRVTSYTSAATELTIFEGGNDDTNNWTITKTYSPNSLSSLDTAISNNEVDFSSTSTSSSVLDSVEVASVTFTCVKSGVANIIRTFSLVKVKTGEDGESPTIYSLEPTTLVVNTEKDHSQPNPSTVTFNAYQQTGNTKTPYSGHIQLYIDDSSSISESITTNISSRTINFNNAPWNTANRVKAVLYKADTDTDKLDEQTVIVVYDGLNGLGAANVILGNEADTIPCTSSHHPIPNGTGVDSDKFIIDIPYKAYQGITERTVVVTAPTLSANDFGVAVTPDMSTTGHIKYKIPSNATLKEGGLINLSFTISIQSYNEYNQIITSTVTVNKYYTWSRSSAAINGTDALQVSVHSTIGGQIKNSQGIGCIYVRVTQGNTILDPVPTDIQAGTSTPSNPSNGDYFIILSSQTNPYERTAKLCKYNSSTSTWVDVNTIPEEARQCGYLWTFKDKDGKVITNSTKKPYQNISNTKSNQFIYIDGSLVDNKMIIDVEVTGPTN